MSKWLVGSSRSSMCGICHESQAKHDTTLLSVRQLLDRRRLGLPCDSIPANHLPHFVPLLEVGELLQHVVEWGEVHFKEFMEMLVVKSKFEMVVSSNHTLCWHFCPVDQLDQGGLPSPVGPHQGQPGVQVHSKLQILVDPRSFIVVAEADILDHDDWRGDLAAVVEAEGDGPVGDDLLGEPVRHHLGQSLLLALRLSRKFGASVTKPCNVLLHVGNLFLLPVVLLHLRLDLLASGLHKLVVVSSVDLQLAQVHVHD